MTDSSHLNKEAFERFLRVPALSLKRFFESRRVLRHDIDELLQDSFMIVWKRRESIQAGKHRAFLYAAAVNHLKHYRRKQKADAEKRKLFGELQKSGTSHTPQLGEDELSAEMKEAVEQLPPRQREVIERVFVKGQSHAEAAEALGISHKSLSQKKIRALKKLKEGLEFPEGGDQ